MLIQFLDFVEIKRKFEFEFSGFRDFRVSSSKFTAPRRDETQIFHTIINFSLNDFVSYSGQQYYWTERERGRVVCSIYTRNMSIKWRPPQTGVYKKSQMI